MHYYSCWRYTKYHEPIKSISIVECCTFYILHTTYILITSNFFVIFMQYFGSHGPNSISLFIPFYSASFKWFYFHHWILGFFKLRPWEIVNTYYIHLRLLNVHCVCTICGLLRSAHCTRSKYYWLHFSFWWMIANDAQSQQLPDPRIRSIVDA